MPVVGRRWTHHLYRKMLETGDPFDAGLGRWSFGGRVADGFDQHIERSVPFYHEGHDLVLRLSDFFLRDGTICYEIGCSTGALTKLLGDRNQDRNASIIGIDIQEEMVASAKARCEHLPNVQLVHADACEFGFEEASLIVCYYSMQFIHPAFRQRVFDKLFRALSWGGALVLFEKVRAPDARFQDITTALYTEFKLEHGFSEQQVVQKARSLTGVLEPFSTSGNLGLLKRAGFVDIMTIFKYVCFEGFLAIK